MMTRRQFPRARLGALLGLAITCAFAREAPGSGQTPAAPSCPRGSHQVRASSVHTESDHALACADANGVWTGPYQERFADDTLAVKGAYQVGQPDGPWLFYYKSGAIMMSGAFRAGQREGVWTSFYENGRKLGSGPYHNDQLQGRWVTWYEDGTLKSEGSYHDGEESGLWSFWYPNGKLEKKGQYFGRRVVPPKNVSVPAELGLWTYWYDNGLKRIEGKFCAGERVGLWTEWSEDGSVSAQTQFPDSHGSDGRCP